jgi:hypothetical protein
MANMIGSVVPISTALAIKISERGYWFFPRVRPNSPLVLANFGFIFEYCGTFAIALILMRQFIVREHLGEQFHIDQGGRNRGAVLVAIIFLIVGGLFVPSLVGGRFYIDILSAWDLMIFSMAVCCGPLCIALSLILIKTVFVSIISKR